MVINSFRGIIKIYLCWLSPLPRGLSKAWRKKVTKLEKTAEEETEPICVS